MELRNKIAAAARERGRSVRADTLFGEPIELRSMTVGGRRRFREATRNGEPQMDELYALVLSETVYDPTTGEPVFAADDADLIGSMDGAEIHRVMLVALEVSGLTSKALGDAGKE